MPPIATASAALAPDAALDELTELLRRHRRWFVLTGAGISTAAGIPDYRDADGQWKQRQPIQYQAFVAQTSERQRYWARSMVGWPRFGAARPSTTHRALAALERAGYVYQLVTQNVDGLHQQAGSRRVIDLHGRLDTVECLDCQQRLARRAMQARLEHANPDFQTLLQNLPAATAPDGDAVLEGIAFGRFNVPDCPRCGGLLKPRVVFFGEAVPKARVELVRRRLREADALLVVGSSLMVYSGYRFCRQALEQAKPVAAINLGRTRADAELDVKVVGVCDEVLAILLQRLNVVF